MSDIGGGSDGDHVDHADHADHVSHADHVNGDIVPEHEPDPYEWEDDPMSGTNPKDPMDARRQVRNKTEKQRKDKIRGWISRISDILPGGGDRLGTGKKQPSMNIVLEKCYEYMVFLKEQNSALMNGKGDEIQADEIKRLKKELTEAHEERDAIASLLKEAKARIDVSRVWNDRMDFVRANPEKMDLTKLLKSMRNPNSLEHVSQSLLARESLNHDANQNEKTKKKSRKNSKSAKEEERESETEVLKQPPLIDCNGESNEVPMFSPASDISNITPVDIPIPEIPDDAPISAPVTSSSIGRPPTLFRDALTSQTTHSMMSSELISNAHAHTALQTLASVATTEMAASDRPVSQAQTTETDQSQAMLHSDTSLSTSVTQSLTMPIMSTSAQKSSAGMTGTQLSGNIIMQNGQLIVLNDPISSDGKKKSPEKQKPSSESSDVAHAQPESLDQSQQLLAQQNALIANQQLSQLGMANQSLPILAGNQAVVPGTPGILPGLNIGQVAQQSNLPQALILPDGRIIPVVTQPNIMFPNQPMNSQIILPGGQQQALIGSNGNLFMHQQGGVPTSQVTTATSGAGIQNLESQLGNLQSQIINHQVLNQQGLPMTNYVMTPDGQMIQSIAPQGLGQQHFSAVQNQQFANFQQNAKTTTSNNPNPQNSSQQQSFPQQQQQLQVITSNGTLLLMPPGAQNQQLLLDPNTLQPIVPQPKPLVQAQSQPVTTTSTTSSAAALKKKGTGGGKRGERILMPKPPHVIPGATLGAPNIVQIHTAPTPALEKDKVPIAPLGQDDAQQHKAIESQPVSKEPANMEMDSRDILAKATESIFGGLADFCQDEKLADENPPPEEKKKRRKKSAKSKTVEAAQEVPLTEPTLVLGTTAPSTTVPLIMGSDVISQAFMHATEPLQSSENLLAPTAPAPRKKPKKKAKPKEKGPEPDPHIDPNSLPDTITFDENDLSAVLDQVEKISVPEVPETPPEKKSRKAKTDSGEPDKKKRKKEKEPKALDFDMHDEVPADPGLQIVLDPPVSTNITSPLINAPEDTVTETPSSTSVSSPSKSVEKSSPKKSNSSKSSPKKTAKKNLEETSPVTPLQVTTTASLFIVTSSAQSDVTSTASSTFSARTKSLKNESLFSPNSQTNSEIFSSGTDSTTPAQGSQTTPFSRDSDQRNEGGFNNARSTRPTKDATLKAVDADESKDATILDTITQIMDSPISAPPATPSSDMQIEKDSLLNDNLSLLSSMAAADREHDRSDENATQKELFPDLPPKQDDRQKDNFSPFNFTDSPHNAFDKRSDNWKDLSPTSSASAPLLRHSVEALFSSGKIRDKDTNSMPGSILSQLNSPSDLPMTQDHEKIEESAKTFPAQQLLPELDTKTKEPERKDSQVRTGFFTSEGLVQPTERPKEPLTTPSYFDQIAMTTKPETSIQQSSVIQNVNKSDSKQQLANKDVPKSMPPQGFYGSLHSSPEKNNSAFVSDKNVSEFVRNSPVSSNPDNTFLNPPVSQTANNNANNSSAFSVPPVTSSMAPFSFSLTSTVNSSSSATTTTVPSSGSFGSHQFPFYPLHPSLSTPASQHNDAMNLNLPPFSESSGRLPHSAPPPLSSAHQSQPRYPNYGMGQMNQSNQFMEPQSRGPNLVQNRFPHPRRGNEMGNPRPPFPDLNQSAPPFDPAHRMGAPRLPNQFPDMQTGRGPPQRPPETSQSPTLPAYTSPMTTSMPGCEMGGTKNRTPEMGPRPSPGEINRGRRQSEGSHIGNSPRMSDINQSPRMSDMNQSPRLADLSPMNQSPRLSEMPTQSPRVDQSPGRADPQQKRLPDMGPQQQQRPRSGPGLGPSGPMFYPPGFSGPPSNPMASPPLHHPNRPAEIENMRPNFESTFNAQPQDFNPVLNFGASGFDPPALELSSSTPTATTQSASLFSRTNQPPVAPPTAAAPKRERAQPAPKRAPANPKPKSRAKAKKPNPNRPYEMDTANLSNSIFETGRSMTPYFPLTSMPSPPPSRNDAPTYIGMPFGPSRPLSNTPGLMQKPSPDSFGPLFPGNRPQNGLPLNFQPGFGMNHMPHSNPGNHGNATVTPHMPNFSLSNIFSDIQGQPDSLNISPIKFAHGNGIGLPQPDAHGLQHHHHPAHHQPGIYHQRGHAPMIPNAMSIGNLLGHHNPHGFDGRPMGPGMGPPFHGPGSAGTFGMPPFNLNMNMHDHH